MLFKRASIYEIKHDMTYILFEDFDPLISEIPNNFNFKIINRTFSKTKTTENKLNEFLKEIYEEKIADLELIKWKKYDEFQIKEESYLMRQYEYEETNNLAKIYKLLLPYTRKLLVEDGKIEKVHSNIKYDEGMFLNNLIKKYKSKKILEVGMAYGMSSLFITDAIPRDGRLISIDPFQDTQWKNRGVDLLKRVKMDAKHKLIKKKSYEALPELLEEGEKYDFIFIDGWHTFDYTLLDFFYSDLLLKKGGVIVVDDVLHRGVAKFIRYILSNYTHYKMIKMEKMPSTMMAFEKKEEDGREWNFHKDF